MSLHPRVRSPSRPWTTCAIAIVAIVHACTFLGSGPCDDDAIVWRFARNLADGIGPVFQSGERVEGFTCPLWVVWLAAGIRLGIRPETLSLCTSILSAGAAAAGACVAWRLIRPTSRLPWAGAFVACSSALAWHSIAGLGTSLAAALVVWSLVFDHEDFERRSSAFAALLLGSSVLLRPELGVLLLVWVATRSSFAWRTTLLALAPGAAWLGFRLVYFERWMPMPFYVKRLPLEIDLGYGLRYAFHAIGTTGIPLLVLVSLGWLVKRDSQRTNFTRAWTLGLALFSCGVVWTGGDYFRFARFFVPVLPLAAVLGGSFVLGSVSRRVAWVAGTVSIVALQWTQFVTRRDVFECFAANEARFIQLGRHFEALGLEDASVALSPIGYFGWHSNLRIVDILGLTNTAVMQAEPNLAIELKGHHRSDARWVLAQHPDFIVLGNGRLLAGDDGRPLLMVSAWEREFMTGDTLARNYRAIVMTIPDGAPLICYLRRGRALPPNARALGS